MTDQQPDAPVKRTSRLRQPPPEAAVDTQEAAAATTPQPSLAVAPEPKPEPESLAPAAPAPLPSAPPERPPEPPQVALLAPSAPFQKHDVVQILDQTSRHYGGFFIVGDVLRD